MREWLTRGQLGLMRLIGMRKLREAIEAKSDGVRTDLLDRFDVLRGELASRENAHDQRLTALGREIEAVQAALSKLALDEGDRGRAAHERGMTLDARLGALEAVVAKLVESLRLDLFAQALGDIRVEISSLRADFAREAEMRDLAGGDRSSFDGSAAPFS